MLGVSFIWVHTAAADQPLVTLQAGQADDLGQSHRALEATLGADSLITPQG